MQTLALEPEQFNSYPPLAKQIALSNIELLRGLPLAFAPLLLRELIGYDWKFPAERAELDAQFKYLNSLSPQQRAAEMQSFAGLKLAPELGRLEWVSDPAGFSERLSAYLWTSHQMDAFRAASIHYVDTLHAATPPTPAPTYRVGMVVFSEALAKNAYPVFRKLRPQGVHFTNIDATNCRPLLLDALRRRANSFPAAFGHWYIDGARNDTEPGITTVCYAALDDVRSALVTKMRQTMQPGKGGPEYLRTMLARMGPEDFGLDGRGDAGLLNRFKVSVLTEGSGTQLFSTTFVQWSAREALRRAQPLTLLVRFTPRQREQSMRELLAGEQQQAIPDPVGSLVDADMGAYYTWINQQRLPGASQSRFLVCFENHNEALAIAPHLPNGAVRPNATTLQSVLSMLHEPA